MIPTTRERMQAPVIPEPVTPLVIIRDSSCHGVTGKVGREVAHHIIAALDKAGFIIVAKEGN